MAHPQSPWDDCNAGTEFVPLSGCSTRRKNCIRSNRDHALCLPSYPILHFEKHRLHIGQAQFAAIVLPQRMERASCNPIGLDRVETGGKEGLHITYKILGDLGRQFDRFARHNENIGRRPVISKARVEPSFAKQRAAGLHKRPFNFGRFGVRINVLNSYAEDSKKIVSYGRRKNNPISVEIVRCRHGKDCL